MNNRERSELERSADVVAVANWGGDKNSMRNEFMLFLSFDLWDLLRCVWFMLSIFWYSHLRLTLYLLNVIICIDIHVLYS